MWEGDPTADDIAINNRATALAVPEAFGTRLSIRDGQLLQVQTTDEGDREVVIGQADIRYTDLTDDGIDEWLVNAHASGRPFFLLVQTFESRTAIGAQGIGTAAIDGRSIIIDRRYEAIVNNSGQITGLAPE